MKEREGGRGGDRVKEREGEREREREKEREREREHEALRMQCAFCTTRGQKTANSPAARPHRLWYCRTERERDGEISADKWRGHGGGVREGATQSC